MSKFRIPTKAILELADRVRNFDNSDPIESFEWTSPGGNTLVGKRVLPEDEYGKYDVWDFEYNPGD